MKALVTAAQFSIPKPLIALNYLAKISYAVKFEFFPLSLLN